MPTNPRRRTGTPRLVRLLVCVLAAAVGAAAFFEAPTWASQRLSDVDATVISLKVNARGEALVVYRTKAGAVRRVLAWGAINARPASADEPQVRLRLDYSGGWAKYRRPIWRGFRTRCRPYDGPNIEYFVTACKAPDGSYWALQSWQRVQPLRGFDAFRPTHMAHELHLSHWNGPLAVLEVSPNWTYGGRFQGLFGRLLYRGHPVYGRRTPSTKSTDPFARYFYIDTLNSVFGRGWKRDAAKVAHLRNGGFCFSFVPQKPPPGYPDDRIRPPGNGERHRVTIMGPGVTPVIRWEGAGLGVYDAEKDETYNRLFDRIIGAEDKVCTRER
jgi:hypothetical protein